MAGWRFARIFVAGCGGSMNQTRQGPRRSARFPLRVEGLEGRRLLSGGPSLSGLQVHPAAYPAVRPNRPVMPFATPTRKATFIDPSASIHAVLDYLDRVDPEAAGVARQRYGCLTPWANEPQAYGRMALSRGYAACEDGVVKTLGEMLGKQLEYVGQDGDSFLEEAPVRFRVADAEADCHIALQISLYGYGAYRGG